MKYELVSIHWNGYEHVIATAQYDFILLTALAGDMKRLKEAGYDGFNWSRGRYTIKNKKTKEAIYNIFIPEVGEMEIIKLEKTLDN